MFPREKWCRNSLAKRDVGSRALAQFKQAMTISLMVLTAIVGLSLVVKKATTPVLEAAPEPPVIMPQPALSLCSADHEKFMEEFRCQIRAYALNADTDQPFCGDKGSTVNTSRPLSRDFADLQALYCGIEIERQMLGFGEMSKIGMTLDSWQPKPVSMYLGYPWQYQGKKGPTGEDFYPNPEAFSRVIYRSINCKSWWVN